MLINIPSSEMFEGLGLGARLSALALPESLSWARYAAACTYAIMNPIGLAAGLGVRHSYNGNGEASMIVSGVLDSISAGILLYTGKLLFTPISGLWLTLDIGLVELLAHEILLNPRMMKSSNGKLTFVFICILLGAGLMALLGRWA
jgi:zinc transporter 1/2/3